MVVVPCTVLRNALALCVVNTQNVCLFSSSFREVIRSALGDASSVLRKIPVHGGDLFGLSGTSSPCFLLNERGSGTEVDDMNDAEYGLRENVLFSDIGSIGRYAPIYPKRLCAAGKQRYIKDSSWPGWHLSIHQQLSTGRCLASRRKNETRLYSLLKHNIKCGEEERCLVPCDAMICPSFVLLFDDTKIQMDGAEGGET